jgi:hypothetical protein
MREKERDIGRERQRERISRAKSCAVKDRSPPGSVTVMRWRADSVP